MLNFLYNNWENFVTVASLVVAVFSLWKMRSAKQAANIARQKLQKQFATEVHRNLARLAGELQSTIMSAEWTRSAQLARSLGLGLATARGTWYSLLTGSERDKLEVAVRTVDGLARRLPLRERPADEEEVRRAADECSFVVLVLAEIVGRLTYSVFSEEE